MGFDNCFCVNSRGRSGGLALLGKSSVHFEIVSYTNWHISGLVKSTKDGTPWLVTGFYIHPNTVKRSTTWHLLKALTPASNIPWLCFGDFNAIMSIDEKVGAAIKPYK